MVPQPSKLPADPADFPVGSAGDAIIADHALPICTGAAIGMPGPVAQALGPAGNMVKGRQPQLAGERQLPQSPLALGLRNHKTPLPGAACNVRLKIQEGPRILQSCRMKNTAAHVVSRDGREGIVRTGKRRHRCDAASPAPQKTGLEVRQGSAALGAAIHLIVPLPCQGIQLLQKPPAFRQKLRLRAVFQPGRCRQRRHGDLRPKSRLCAQCQSPAQLLQGIAALLRLPALPAAALQADKVHPCRLHGRKILPDLLR